MPYDIYPDEKRSEQKPKRAHRRSNRDTDLTCGCMLLILLILVMLHLGGVHLEHEASQMAKMFMR